MTDGRGQVVPFGRRSKARRPRDPHVLVRRLQLALAEAIRVDRMDVARELQRLFNDERDRVAELTPETRQ